MPRRACQLPISLTMPHSNQPQYTSCSQASLPTYLGVAGGDGARGGLSFAQHVPCRPANQAS